MNVLFVCTFGLQRSPTAANVFWKLAQERGVAVNVKHAGISSIAPHGVDRELIQWADKIYVMENLQKDFITGLDKTAEKKIEVLHITDNYLRDDSRLVAILRKKFEKEI